MFRRKPKELITPEWLIVGLGNPGGEYRGTRHNVGFDVIDLLASRNRIKLGSGKHRAMIGTGRIGDTQVVLAKPLTYMNRSGQSVAPLAREYSLSPDRILVVADDLDLQLGVVKLKERGSSGGHNGHKSLIEALKSQEYPRVKVGIGSVGRNQTIDHVLSKFSFDEQPLVEEAVRAATETSETLVQRGRPAALEVLARFKSISGSEDREL